MRLPNCSKYVFLCNFFQSFVSGFITDLHQFKQNLIQGTSCTTISKASDIPTTKVNISCQREANHSTVGKTKSPTYLADLRENHLLRGKKYYFPSVGLLFFFFFPGDETWLHWAALVEQTNKSINKQAFLDDRTLLFCALSSSRKTARSTRYVLLCLFWTGFS